MLVWSLSLTLSALAPQLVAPRIAQPGRVTAPALLRLRMCASGALDASLGAAAADFLNEKLPADVVRWALQRTEVGEKYRSKNAWSRGLWKVDSAVVCGVDESGLALQVTVTERGKPSPLVLPTRLQFSSRCTTADALRDELIRINSAGSDTGGTPAPAGGDASADLDTLRASGSILGLPGASDRFSLPPNIWLNTTPSPRGVRRMFYSDITSVVLSAVADTRVPRRMKARTAGHSDSLPGWGPIFGAGRSSAFGAETGSFFREWARLYFLDMARLCFALGPGRDSTFFRALDVLLLGLLLRPLCVNTDPSFHTAMVYSPQKLNTRWIRTPRPTHLPSSSRLA